MRDLRRIERKVVSPDPESDRIDKLEGSYEYHRLSDNNGAPESFYTTEEATRSCGCFGPVGGRCGEPGCHHIDCSKCFKHCGGTSNQSRHGCGKPLCRAHSHYFDMPDDRTIPLCRRCYRKLIRRKRWLAVILVVLNLFIFVLSLFSNDRSNRNG